MSAVSLGPRSHWELARLSPSLLVSVTDSPSK